VAFLHMDWRPVERPTVSGTERPRDGSRARLKISRCMRSEKVSKS
jgi:hypothetical protein